MRRAGSFRLAPNSRDASGSVCRTALSVFVWLI